jgi:nucleoside-diphosphate-sugar epimerase
LIALVTGATGFIGSHLVESLLQKGLQVRVLVRHTSRLQWLEGLGVENVLGDLCDDQSLPALRSALQGVDYVFHLAGSIHAVTKQDYFRINTEGTVRLLQAAADAKGPLKKFIFVSSQSAGGPSQDARGVREDDLPSPLSHYGQSKLKAEREVLRFAGSFPVVILRPPTIYGPRETRVYAVFKMMKRGFALAPGQHLKHVSFCYVSDLIEAIEAAAFQSQPNGRVYNVMGERSYEWLEFMDAIGKALNRRYRVVRIPDPILLCFGAVGEIVSRLSGRSVLFTVQKVKEFSQNNWVIDGTRIREELGWREKVSLSEGMAKTAAWYKRAGWL